MARVPSPSSLSAPRLGGGRATRDIPTVQVPTFDVPVPDLPERVAVPTVDLPTPDLPNAVNISNDVNVNVPNIPGQLYSGSDINALGAPGRALANLGETVVSEARQWGSYLGALESNKARSTMLLGLSQLDKELEDDPDWRTKTQRYQAGAAKVREQALSHLTTQNGQIEFASQFDERMISETERVHKQAKAQEADQGRAELTTLLKTSLESLSKPGMTEDRKVELRQDAEDAIDKMFAAGYIDAENAEKMKSGFKSDAAMNEVVNLIDLGRDDPNAYEEARTRLDGGKALSGLRKAPQEVQQGIAYAAEKTGISAVWLAEMAQAESSFNPNAKNPNSSATGLFQFTDATWLSALRKTAKRNDLSSYGIDLSKLSEAQLLSLRSDPVLQSLVMAEHTLDHAMTIEERLGGKMATLKDIYLAHFMGIKGAVTMLQAIETDPNAPAETLFAKEAKANPELFQGKTVAEAYMAITGKVGDGKSSFEYEALSTEKRLALKNAADTEEHRSRTQRDDQRKARKAAVERMLLDDLDLSRKTGDGLDPGELDPDEVADLLGPERAAEHREKRETEQAKFTVTEGFESMPADEIDARLRALEAQPEDRVGRAQKEEIYQAAVKRADEIAKERDYDSAKAVEMTPEVQHAVAMAEQEVDGVLPDPAFTQKRIAEARMAAQRRLGIEENPLDRDESKRLLRRVITTTPKKSDQGWIEVINDVEATYGKELGKKVLSTALAYELREDRDQAPIIANWIGKVARGEGISDADISQFYELKALKASQGFMSPRMAKNPRFNPAGFESPALTALGVAQFEEGEAGSMPRTRGIGAASQSLPRQPVPKAAKEALKLYPDRADEFMRKYGLTREEVEKIINQ